MERRVVVLIDGSNLFLGAKRFEKKIWPADLVEFIKGKLGSDVNPIIKVHFFTSVDKNNQSQRRFLNHLARTGIIVHDFDLRTYENRNPCSECNRTCPQCGRDMRMKPHKEKMIDIAIATEMIEIAFQKEPHNFHTFVVVSGDKDLIPAIRLLRNKLGKEIVIVGFRHKDPHKNSLAYELNKEADRIINLTELVEEKPCDIPDGGRRT